MKMKSRWKIVTMAGVLLAAMTARASDLTIHGNLNATGNVSGASVTLGGDTRTNWPGSGAVDLTEPVVDFAQPTEFYRLTMSDDTEWTFTNHVAGRVVRLRVAQDETGGWNSTWPEGVLWPDSGAPVAGAANAISVYKFVDDGTYWLAQAEAVNYQVPGASSGDYALQFGSADYVTMGGGNAFFPPSALTMEFWFKSTDTPSGQFWPVGNWPGMLIQIWGAYPNQSVQFGIQSQGGQHWTSSGNATVTDGGWHHIAGVWTGTQLLCFVDGAPVGSASWSSPPDVSSADFRVGKQANLGANWNAVTMDLVRVSSVARYTDTFTPETDFTADSNTVGLWKFNEGTGTTAADSGSNGHPGTLTGNPTWVSGATVVSQQRSMMQMGGSSLTRSLDTFSTTLSATNAFSAPVSLTLTPSGQ